MLLGLRHMPILRSANFKREAPYADHRIDRYVNADNSNAHWSMRRQLRALCQPYRRAVGRAVPAALYRAHTVSPSIQGWADAMAAMCQEKTLAGATIAPQG